MAALSPLPIRPPSWLSDVDGGDFLFVMWPWTSWTGSEGEAKVKGQEKGWSHLWPPQRTLQNPVRCYSEQALMSGTHIEMFAPPWPLPCSSICDRRLTPNPLLNGSTIERRIDLVSHLAKGSRARWRALLHVCRSVSVTYSDGCARAHTRVWAHVCVCVCVLY